MEVVGLPPEVVTDMRSQPLWSEQESMAHTLVYETTILGDYSLPEERAAQVNTPTLVMAGGTDFPWIPESAKSLAKLIPGAKTHFLDGQSHSVDPAVLAPVLIEFFTSLAAC
jgi:pimeloyl-ACP methyl ester carboxylesterase